MAAHTQRREAEPSIGRLGFWLTFVCVVSGALALSLFVQQSLADGALGLSRGAWHAVIWAAALSIVWIASLRRLRDRGRSPLWLVPFIAGPVAAEGLAILLRSADGGTAAQAASFSSFVLTVWALIELGVMPGLVPEAQQSPGTTPPRRRPAEPESAPADAADVAAKPTVRPERDVRPRSAGRRERGHP